MATPTDPPPAVAPPEIAHDPARRYILTLDIGGTKVAAVRYDEATLAPLPASADPSAPDGGASEVDYIPAELLHDEETFRTLVSRLVESRGLQALAGIGVSVAGSVDPEAGVVITSPNIAWLRDANLRDVLQREFAVPAIVENDGNAFALAEARWGLARGLDHVVGYTLGTGIGGGIVIDGRIHHGSGIGAAELGHVTINVDGPQCSCGQRGCLESYIAGWALARTVATMFESGFFSKTRMEGVAVDGETLRIAGEQGDEFAVLFWHTYGDHLATGVSQIVNILRPQAIVFGGSGAKSWHLFEQTFNLVLRQRTFPPFHEAMRIGVATCKHAMNAGAAILLAERLATLKT